MGEIATLHGELKSLEEAGEGNRGRVITFNDVNHAHIVSHSQGIASLGRGFFEELCGRKCLSIKGLGLRPRREM